MLYPPTEEGGLLSFRLLVLGLMFSGCGLLDGIKTEDDRGDDDEEWGESAGAGGGAPDPFGGGGTGGGTTGGGESSGGGETGGGEAGGSADGDGDSVDNDGDGFTLEEGDCNDDDETVFPGAEEECNGIDDDCDYNIDDGLDTTRYYQDGDGDGYGDPDERVEACEVPDDYVDNNEDCDDGDRTINPESEEVSFNGTDENCDGLDFTGLECAEDAFDLTMEWMEYWAWEASDTSGDIPTPIPLVTGSYTMQEKLLEVNSTELVATAVDGDALKVDVEIETQFRMSARMQANALGLFQQDCTLTIHHVPVLYTGQIHLDVDGGVVSGEADFYFTVLEATGYSADRYSAAGEIGCSISTIDMILEYLGYSIDDFIFEDIAPTADELREQIEDALEAFDIPAACN